MKNTLITLAKLSFHLGLIGLDEYQERIAVALWVTDKTSAADPRYDHNETAEEFERDIESNSNGVNVLKPTEDEWLEFVFEGKWYFTKSDPDCYPAVPHGHYQNKNSKWPKLNPYTGRAFNSKHQEEKSKSLSKKQILKIWSDKKFISFCREFIVWYIEFSPNYFYPGFR